MTARPRRNVGWTVVGVDHGVGARRLSASPECGALARITSALFSSPSARVVDRVLRDCVEFARDIVQLDRASIFLLAPNGRSMIGTWGSDSRGETTDEHDLVFDVDDALREFLSVCPKGHAWSVLEDCPLMTHEAGTSRSVGQGWIACTAIHGSSRPIGVLFNDTAISHAPFDEARQTRAALLCSVLGRGLDACRDRLFEYWPPGSKSPNRLVQMVSQALATEPSLSFQELAQRLRVTRGHLTRTFKRHTNLSIVDCRNKLRLNQFMVQVKDKGILDAALGAGFGSYAQFHRVFRERFGVTPREYPFELQTKRSQS